MRRMMMIASTLVTLTAPVARASAAGWTAYSVNASNNTVTRFDTASGAPEGTSIPVGSNPAQVAITPDGTAAYVTDSGSSLVTPIDLATNTAGSPILTGAAPEGIAITPDGRTAYVADSLVGGVRPIDLATDVPAPSIPVGGSPVAVAITPDGTAAYVTNQTTNSVTRISTATNTAGTQIPVGRDPDAIAITPNGQTAYVVNRADATVTPIDLANNTAAAPISVGSDPSAVAIAPDGQTAYVANEGDGTVTPITIATNTPGSPIPAPNDLSSPTAISITPDGKTAYVADPADAETVPISLVTDIAGPGVATGGDPIAQAITPDQAPTAAFTATTATAGQAVILDASTSSTPVGSIARYHWDFGDGQSLTTPLPAVAHVFAAPRVYAVGLTVTNTAETSVAQIFTGQTVSLEGGPQATIDHAVTVAAPAATPAPPVTTKPVTTPPMAARLSGLRVVPGAVSTAGRRVHGRCVASRRSLLRAPRCRRKVVLHVRYRLSAAATVTVRIARITAGRTVNERCVVATHANRARHRCTRRSVFPGKIVRRAGAGTRLLTISRFGRRRLADGSYRLTLTPQGGQQRTATFRITG